MKTCVQLLDELKRHLEAKTGEKQTDADAARALKISRVAVHKVRHGKNLLADSTGKRLAVIVGLDPLYVRKCIELERAKRDVGRLQGELDRAVKILAAGGVGALLVASAIGALQGFDISQITAALGILAAPASTVYTLCAIAVLALAYAAARRAAAARTYPSTPETLLARSTRSGLR